MKNFALIEIEDTGYTIVLPVQNAGDAATLLARASVYKKDSYPNQANFIRAEKGVNIRFSDGDEFEQASEKLKAAQKEYSEANSARWTEYTRANKAEAEAKELRAKLETLQAAITCTVPEPDAEPPTSSEEEE